MFFTRFHFLFILPYLISSWISLNVLLCRFSLKVSHLVWSKNIPLSVINNLKLILLIERVHSILVCWVSRSVHTSVIACFLCLFLRILTFTVLFVFGIEFRVPINLNAQLKVWKNERLLILTSSIRLNFCCNIQWYVGGDTRIKD